MAKRRGESQKKRGNNVQQRTTWNVSGAREGTKRGHVRAPKAKGAHGPGGDNREKENTNAKQNGNQERKDAPRKPGTEKRGSLGDPGHIK